MQQMTEPQQMEQYLATLTSQLAYATPSERAEILNEIRTHFTESLAQPGASMASIIARLGSPEELAAQYRESVLLQRAARSSSPLTLFKAALRLTTKGVSGFLVFVFALFGYGMGGGLALTGVLKPFWPERTGFWVHNGHIEQAGIQLYVPKPPVHDALGWWYTPVALGVGCLLVVLTMFAIRGCLRLSRFAQTRLQAAIPNPGPAWSVALLLISVVSFAMPSHAQQRSQSTQEQSAKMQAQSAKLSPVGDWTGSLHVQQRELHLALHVTAAEDGALQVTLDSIDQGAKAIPGNAVIFKSHEFSFDIPAIRGHYAGQLSDDGNTITGTWSQGAASLPLAWQRGMAAKLDRPQEPKPPFPYAQEEVWVANREAGIRLAGTLTKPNGAGPFPAVFLITGSGPQDRDKSIFGHKPFLVLADYLTRTGIAVLRVDDRGTGRSTGNFQGATTEDFAGDALAAAAFLKQRRDVDGTHIGLIGHSEGGIIAPMVAIQSHDIAFLVLLAGTAVPGAVLLPEQVYQANLAAGVPEATARANAARNAALLRIAEREPDPSRALAQALALPGEADPALKPQLEAAFKEFSTPWFRFFATYDPYPTLRRVTCPVLALVGSKDVQVPAALNVPFLRAAIASNPHSLVMTVPGVNHVFQTANTGSPAEYAQISETLSPGVLKTVSDWIHQQL